jgi:hypothetical protein
MKFEVGQLIRSTNMKKLNTPTVYNPSNIYRVTNVYNDVVATVLINVLDLDTYYSRLQKCIGKTFSIYIIEKTDFRPYNIKIISNLKR